MIRWILLFLALVGATQAHQTSLSLSIAKRILTCTAPTVPALRTLITYQRSLVVVDDHLIGENVGIAQVLHRNLSKLRHTTCVVTSLPSIPPVPDLLEEALTQINTPASSHPHSTFQRKSDPALEDLAGRTRFDLAGRAYNRSRSVLTRSGDAFPLYSFFVDRLEHLATRKEYRAAHKLLPELRSVWPMLRHHTLMGTAAELYKMKVLAPCNPNDWSHLGATYVKSMLKDKINEMLKLPLSQIAPYMDIIQAIKNEAGCIGDFIRFGQLLALDEPDLKMTHGLYTGALMPYLWNPTQDKHAIYFVTARGEVGKVRATAFELWRQVIRMPSAAFAKTAAVAPIEGRSVLMG